MPKIISDFVKGYVFRLSEEKYSFSQVIKLMKEKNIMITKCTISRIIKENKENFDCSQKNNKKVPINQNLHSDTFRRKKPLTPKQRQIREMVIKENPPSQRTIAARTDIPLTTVNRIIKRDLALKMRKKGKVHRLQPHHIKQRKTCARKLYERHLSGEKWMNVVTLDEAWVYLNDCNVPRAIYYANSQINSDRSWIKQCRESFSRGFMIVAGFCFNGKLKLKKVDPKVKINSSVYQRLVLDPLFDTEIPDLYGDDANHVCLHQDKATSHTSRATVQYMAQKHQETGISFIPFSDIPAKSPDLAPMDFCAFGLLKSALRNRRPNTLDGLWKVVNECWADIDINILRRSLISWKHRCRYVAKNHGHHLEHKKLYRNV